MATISNEIVEKFKFRFKFLTDNTMKLIWGYLTMTMNMTMNTNMNDFVNDFDEIGLSGEKFKFLTDNTMKMMEKRTWSCSGDT